MHPFIAASTFALVESAPAPKNARFTTTIEPAWLQGKGAFGGLLNAGVVRAMSSLVDPSRAIRTLHVHFCAPAVPGALDVAVVVEREGASMSTLSARATQANGVVTLASATFAAPRPRPDDRARYFHAVMPDAPRPDEAPLAPRDIPFLPAFTHFFDYRFCVGDPPYATSNRPVLGGWCKFRDRLDAVDAPAIAALADAYPPAVLALLDAPRASGSVDLTVDFFAWFVPADEHVLVVQTSRIGDGGVTDERCDVWTEGGALVCSVRQLVALL